LHEEFLLAEWGEGGRIEPAARVHVCHDEAHVIDDDPANRHAFTPICWDSPMRMPSDVAEPIYVFILDHFVDELRAVVADLGERLVEVVHVEHDTQVAQSVHRGVPMIWRPQADR
jgi:hypothetical protein